MCIAAMKSMTLAQRARSALSGAGIYCAIVSLDPMLSKNGCAYGLSFPCEKRYDLEKVLKKRNIPYGEIFGGRL